jgi:predicted nucleotidyltransferase
MVQPDMIAKATELLRDAARPLKVILFGSYARGNPDEHSDVDILVVERSVPDRVAEMVRLGRVLSPLRIPVDLLVVSEKVFQEWAQAPGSVYYEAARDGRVLYEAA